ncbi:SusC/RagA family TonB-linked outer membrane protein [Tamlana sp. 2201CG12-4]|uniref:SusC/RagA family TonB-linked outer membrane protein n=1 Tax=Tamlana sp. 2201CG12-4 TaxID=3112582 RepID=UPI002DBDBF5E|nr:SusC/RagA family TonB-linked outer membrane protein [Tamlana sp. 2201CG12-4]MEC3906751.1 SusC/RagA family TonB-linked outer membrane protein [Tamlana sp. 2201CG12-4]
MKKNFLIGNSAARSRIREISRIMKLFSIIMLCTTLQVAAIGFGQNAKLSLQAKDKALVEVFDEIKTKTGFTFVYSTEELNEKELVSINVKEAKLSEILNTLLNGKNLGYKIVDNVIVISKKKESENKQERRIQGQVLIHGTNEPLPGATIVVKNGIKGTTTDISGNFSITVDSPNATLLVSYIGFESFEFTVYNQTNFTIYLKESASELDTIVITGMQTREKSKMIGSVSSVSSEAMEFIGATTVDEALKGQMPGLYVRSDSGNPGEVGQIQIRGINTLSGSTSPLYILDGMPLQTGEISGSVNQLLTHGLGNIPPEDIENITILKDATAASIYGARAANGVVVITTKQGQSGKDYISYSGKFGVTMRPENRWDFMNSQQKIEYERGVFDDFIPQQGGRVVGLLNNVRVGNITAAEAEAQIAQLANINTNWVDELYRDAFTQSHILTMSGGTNKLQYHVSANYINAEGTLIENQNHRGGLNVKLNKFVSDDLLIKVNLYSTLKKNTRGLSSEDPFRYAVFANPYERPYDDQGNYSIDRSYLDTSQDLSRAVDLNYNEFNIIRELTQNTKTDDIAQVRGQLGIEYSFLEDFRYVGRAVVDYNTAHSMEEVSPGTYTSYQRNWLRNAATNRAGLLPEFNQGNLRENMGRSLNYTIRNSIEFNKNINKHFVQVFAANEFGATTNYRFGSMLPIYLTDYRLGGYPVWNNISPDNYDALNLSFFGSSFFGESRSVSYIGSGVYSYDNRYVANFNVRYDGVDILGSDNQFQPLWSAGAKWNIHNENFINNQGLINRLVLSAGYGFRGSINREALPFHSYSVSTRFYDGLPSLGSFTFGNPVLKWEKKRDLNLGFELSMFRGRVNIEANYFDEQITDLLDNQSLPISIGRASAFANVGQLSNTGLEISGRFEVINKKDLIWEVGGNLTTVDNQLDQVFEKVYPNRPSFSTQNIEGYPTSSFYGYKFSHVDPDNGRTMVFAQRRNEEIINGETITTFTDELIDLDALTQNELDEDYVTYNLGQNPPKFYGGLNTRVFYKGFDINANFVFAGGNKLVGFKDRRFGPDGGTDDITAARTNRTVDNLYRWTQPGDITNVPAHTRTLTQTARSLLDSDLEDGSYFKCSSLSLGWRASENIIKQLPFTNLSLRLLANNVFTLTKFSGPDPETRRAFGYPNTASYTLSLNLGL